MKKLTFRDVLLVAGLIILGCSLIKGWENVVAFFGILFSSVIPLVLGTAIAYVVSIPTEFLQRHFLPDSKSKMVAAIRRPVSLFVTLVLFLAVIIFSTSVLIPAFIETVTVVQKHGRQFIMDVVQMSLFAPVREPVINFLNSAVVNDLLTMDIPALAQTLFGGNAANLTSHVVTVASAVMTTFFGVLFSFILLTDTTDVGNRLMSTLSEFMGFERTERLALVLGVVDASFHNFIVRQCIEAVILGGVGTAVLLFAHFDYALGVGMLLTLLATIPIVGYPVGLFVGAFMVAIFNPWIALAYIVFVALAQMFESTNILPHVGDPRTVLPPVWVTVGVTIGGGVAGFLGMLVAIPITSSIRQLVMLETKHKLNKRSGLVVTSSVGKASKSLHLREPELSKGIIYSDGNGIGKIE